MASSSSPSDAPRSSWPTTRSRDRERRRASCRCRPGAYVEMVVHVRRILVPTDFSEPADAALRFAVELATRVEAEVILVHAWQLSAFASRKSALARGIE